MSVGSDMLASAYTCSAIKLLWRLNELNKSQENPASNFLDETDARDIIKNILATPDSIRKVATAHRPRELDLRLQTRRRHQRWYTGLYDFSLRYDTEDSKRTGGPNTALSLLDQKQGSAAYATIRKYYPNLGGETEGKKYLNEWNFLAGFVWDNNFGTSALTRTNTPRPLSPTACRGIRNRNELCTF